jgi:hypothetical protein
MEFHYVITLSRPVGDGYATATLDGTVIAREGQTRQELFGDIYRHAADHTHLNNPNVTFFDLAPNTLPSAGNWPQLANSEGQTR